MAAKHVLIVEDEEDIRELVRYTLVKAHFTCAVAADGHEGLQAVRALLPDLILLDLMLPGIDGMELCATLKRDAKTREIPVIMLTAKGAETDIVRGLEAGADDYVTKPFSPKVLVARIEAVLRRRPREASSDDSPLRVNGIVIHPGRQEAIVDGTPVELTATEFKVLAYLARRPGWVFTRSQIVDAVHGIGYPVTDRSVDVQVVGLRKKLGAAGDNIETVRGVGYRFRED